MRKINTNAELAIVLGSGMNGVLSGINIKHKISFNEIESLKQPTVDSHKGEIIVLEIDSKEVIVIKGRLHFYEGYNERELSELTRLLFESGIKRLVLTNASGGVNKNLEEGDLLIIKDQINFRFKTPLRGLGKNNNIQFPDMSKAYCDKMSQMAIKLASAQKIKLKQGVYLGLTGPSLETKAEYKMAIVLGADCIGMSTVPEVVMARFLGIKCLGISVISNVFNEYETKETSFKEVIETVETANKKLSLLLLSLIKEFA